MPEWPIVLDPSPQFMSYVPAYPPTLMVMLSLAPVVFHVVTKSSGPKLAAFADVAAATPNRTLSGTTSSGMSETAPIRLPCASCIVPAGMVKFSSAVPDILARSSKSRVAVTALLGAAAPCSGIVSLPCVMLIVMPFAAVMGSLNCTHTVPLPARYAALSTAGFVVSRTDTVLFEDASMRLPAISATAPCRMSSDITLAWANMSRPAWPTVSVTT